MHKDIHHRMKGLWFSPMALSIGKRNIIKGLSLFCAHMQEKNTCTSWDLRNCAYMCFVLCFRYTVRTRRVFAPVLATSVNELQILQIYWREGAWSAPIQDNT